MTPYPLFYTPDGVARPDCCPHLAPLACLPGKGPDVIAGADGRPFGGAGLCWGGSLPIPGSVRWTKTAAGWYVALDGITPQALRRVTTHPRILSWRTIPGALPGQRWRVPALITSDEDGDPILAVDRILTPNGWRESDDLAPMIEKLISVHNGRPLHEDADQRNAECTALAIAILGLGQWIDMDLATVTGWVSESFLIDVLRAAMNRARDDELADPL